jgi:uncharacterized protein
MLDKETIEILACPVTHQSLQMADAATIARINGAIEAGKLQDQLGRPVKQSLAEGLIREDGKVLYPVREGIPVMLADEGISLDQC